MRETTNDNDNGGCAVVIMWVAIVVLGGLLIRGLVGWIMLINSSIVNYNALQK